jgi:hypothetical protein
MSGLEQYAIPYDPDSTHQLHWTPGNHGKGFYTPEGVLHHWNVSGPDGQPQHRRYIRESPALGYDPYGHPDWENGAKFWIHPSGDVEMLNNFDQLGDVLAIDPRLGAAGNDWHFADYRTQERAIDPGPPKIVSEYPDAAPEAVEYDDYAARRPFIYHAPTNTVYVGRPGTHHHQVMAEYGFNTPPEEGANYEGYIIKDYPQVEGESAYPDEASWFHRAPANHEAVLEEVAKAHGVPPSHFQEKADWRFGTTTDDLMKMFEPLVRTLDKPQEIDPALEERNRQRAEDPLGFERTQDWDREGDVSRGHPDIEWVPTNELRKFIEYDRRPGGKDAWSSPERWDALGEHLKTHGFRNPVWLDFNPDTGYAHMSEGNHRTQLALDHGIPAVPVRVYRSQRTSPTQIPVKAQPQEDWADAFDPTGYHYPQYMKPSHIGLPTVPPPNQRVAHQFNDYGKWAWIEGMAPRFWRDSEYGEPSEAYYEQQMQERGLNTQQRNEAWENGTVEDYGTKPHFEQLIDMAKYHPQLRGAFHEAPVWSDYDNITKRLDKSGLHWAVGTHGPGGAEAFIATPGLYAGDLEEALGTTVQPIRQHWNVQGDTNAYGINRAWHFGAAQYMYHVAPAGARESIYERGLTGHEGYDDVRSPWEQNFGQPPGNYLYEHEPSALVYASMLGAKQNGHMFPGDLGPESYDEHGVIPYGDQGYVRPDPPAESADWDDDQWDQWYENEEEHMVPYNHHDPAHRNLLPPNLQGYDVWRVRADGLPIAPDPEPYLIEKDRDPTIRPLSPDEVAPMGDEEEYDPSAEQRWMTHEHVPPHRVELHRHIPAWEITDEWADRAHERAHEEQALVDPTWTMVHPRHIVPKRVPPEVRKIWGRMREARRRQREGLRGIPL